MKGLWSKVTRNVEEVILRKKRYMKRECPDKKKGTDDKEGSSKFENVVEEQGSKSSDGDIDVN